MHDWRSIDFRNPLEYPLAEFGPGLNTDVAQEGSGHFAEQRFDDVEPRSVLRRQHILKAIRARRQEGPRFFRDVCRMVVEDQSNSAAGRVAASRSFSRSMNSRLRCRRSTRAVTWPSRRSSAARMEQVPSRRYSRSRPTVGCLRATEADPERYWRGPANLVSRPLTG